MDEIVTAGTGFRGLTESVDTTSPAGRVMPRLATTSSIIERASSSSCGLAGVSRSRSSTKR
jgi:hypothetical protein